MVDLRYAPSDFTTNCAVVYRDVISSEEGELLVQDITSRMKRYVIVIFYFLVFKRREW